MMMDDFNYEALRRVVKSDDAIYLNGDGELSPEPNATCSKCGRIRMPFEGFV